MNDFFYKAKLLRLKEILFKVWKEDKGSRNDWQFAEASKIIRELLKEKVKEE